MTKANYLLKLLLVSVFSFSVSILLAQQDSARLHNLTGTLKNTTSEYLEVRIPKYAEFVSTPSYQVLVLQEIQKPEIESGLIQYDSDNAYYTIGIYPNNSIDLLISTRCKNKSASVKGGTYTCTQNEHIKVSKSNDIDKNSYQANQSNNDSFLKKNEERLMLVELNENIENTFLTNQYGKDNSVTSTYKDKGSLNNDADKEKYLIREYLRPLCKEIGSKDLKFIKVKLKSENPSSRTVEYYINETKIRWEISFVKTIINHDKNVKYFILEVKGAKILNSMDTYKKYCFE